jgi:transcriptional regulator with XRE-family HTH domain
MRGLTQRELGLAVGFGEKSADVRIAQYESGTRTPKEKMIADIAKVLRVSSQALTVPDIKSCVGLAHTLFALEDLYGIQINQAGGLYCLTLDKYKNPGYISMLEMFISWHTEMEKLKKGEITEDEYNTWRYTYPKIETERFLGAVRKSIREKNRKDKE